MSERDSERFDIDDDFLAEQVEDGSDYDRMLDRVDKRTRDKTKQKVGKAAWSKLEEVLADRKLKRDLSDFDDYEG
jgi:ferritin